MTAPTAWTVDATAALDRIEDAMMEDIMSLSDEEVLAEAAEDGVDIDALRAMFRAALAKVKP